MAELPPPQERQPWTDIGEIELERIINRGEDGGGYAPPGPCSAAFLQSDARVRGIMGPYGSGKTTTCIWDGMLKARTQPIARDGVRYLETAIVADTYGTLYRNTARTMHREFPKELGNWKGANERPFLFQLKVRDEFGLVYWTIDGLAVGDHAAEDAMDGFEVGHFVLNGASRLREDVLDYALGRVQRGGDRRKLGDEAFALKWTGVTLDWNPPDMDHWLYRRFVTEKPPHFEFYEQPGGREPDAENRDNLAADYYEAGDAVYPTYGRRHRADRELPFDPSLMLHVGIDGGDTLHPAAVFCQRTVEGQWRVLMELYLGRCGASAFAEHLVLCLQDNFPNARLCLHGDPAIDAGADKESGQLSFLDTIELALGCPVQLAPTNEFDPRREVVMQALGRPIEPGGLPGLIVSNQCPSLLAGFGGKYHFPKFKEGGREKTKDRPNKDHPWSDVHDALQYVLLSVEGLASVSAHGRRRDALDGPSRSPGRASAGRTCPLQHELTISPASHASLKDVYGNDGAPLSWTRRLWRAAVAQCNMTEAYEVRIDGALAAIGGFSARDDLGVTEVWGFPGPALRAHLRLALDGVTAVLAAAAERHGALMCRVLSGQQANQKYVSILGFEKTEAFGFGKPRVNRQLEAAQNRERLNAKGDEQKERGLDEAQRIRSANGGRRRALASSAQQRAFKNRRGWDQMIREVYQYILVYRDPADRDGAKSGLRMRGVFDSTAVSSSMRFAGRLKNDIAPALQSFFTLELGPAAKRLIPDQATRTRLESELETIGDVVHAAIDTANFHT
ncbi:Uncharacterized protein SCF082_LOCUS21131, partial [Durusdinium trenchii]